MAMVDTAVVETWTPTVQLAQQDDTQRVLDTLTLAFAADPAVRWMYPEPQQYLQSFPAFAHAFGGRAIARRTAFISEGYSGAALWLPPDTAPDEEGRKAVGELAAHQVDIVKIWVDARDGKYPKLIPELYGAIIDEAHKRGLRVTAHIFALEDAKGLMRAGIDAFAHGVRDRDIDDELVAMFKQRPNLILTPNLPDRGVKVDLSWLRAGMPATEPLHRSAGSLLHTAGRVDEYAPSQTIFTVDHLLRNRT